MKQVMVRLPEDLHRKLKMYAAENGASIQEVVTRLVQEHLAGVDKKKAKKA